MPLKSHFVLIYWVHNFKRRWEIFSNFVAFSKYLNFTYFAFKDFEKEFDILFCHLYLFFLIERPFIQPFLMNEVSNFNFLSVFTWVCTYPSTTHK